MEFPNLKSLNHNLQLLIEKNLWAKVLLALLLGVIAGVILSPEIGWFKTATSHTIGNWLSLPGKLFLKLVQMIMIPLIFTSIISGIISNTGEELKKMGFRVLIYFVATTTISIVVGVALALFFKPGKYIFAKGNFKLPDNAASDMSTQESAFTDIPNAIAELLPENPLEAMVTGEMLSVVIFTIIIGISITQLSEQTKTMVNKFLHATQQICMNIVKWAMLLVPIAVFGLIAQISSSIGFDSLKGIGFYIFVVLLGLVILLIIYLLMVFFLGRYNPFKFLKSITDVQLLAFSTTSSAAVMPLTMKTAEEKLGVSPRVSNFLVPIGATINMDGTAIYQCISTLFIAQAYGLEISIANIVLIMVTIVAASIGTPSIPGGGVVVLASVLQSVGIPTEGIVIIIGVERILGMFRTTINVTGDLVACMVFNRFK